MRALMLGAALSVGVISYFMPAQSYAMAITCWYNPSGKYTGADSGTGMPVGKLVKQRNSGDYAWGYTINAPNGTKCPRRRPSH